MSPMPGGDIPYDCRYSYYNPDDVCEVWYDDPAECEEPCSHSSSSESVSKIMSYVGLAMDAVLFIHCMKNYRNIYPSVFVIVMAMMLNAVQGNIKPTTRSAATLFVLFMLIINILVLCRYFYSAININEACCKGGGLKFQFTCLGVGM